MHHSRWKFGIQMYFSELQFCKNQISFLFFFLFVFVFIVHVEDGAENCFGLLIDGWNMTTGDDLLKTEISITQISILMGMEKSNTFPITANAADTLLLFGSVCLVFIRTQKNFQYVLFIFPVI